MRSARRVKLEPRSGRSDRRTVQGSCQASQDDGIDLFMGLLVVLVELLKGRVAVANLELSPGTGMCIGLLRTEALPFAGQEEESHRSTHQVQ